MLGFVARISVRHWKVVLFLAALYIAYGVHTFRTLSIEAFPDVTDPMVEVVAAYPGQSAEYVERHVTIEIERVLAGTPGLTNLRSVSVFGLSLVTLRFEDGSSDFHNRAHVAERLREARMPEGVEALLGPQATPVGQIFRYTLHGPRSLRELRSIQDWVIERRLRSTPGVADVVTFGGFERQYAVRIDPIRLASMGVSVGQVFTAIETTNANAGGGYVGIGSQDFVVRGLGSMRNPADIGSALVVAGRVPIRVRDVADVVESATPRRGAVGRGNDDEVIEGIVLLRRGENTKNVLAALQDRIDELNGGILPSDVRLVPFYDRRDLIATTVSTVGHNLIHGALLVVVVILLFLRSFPGAFIIGIVIPISLLSSFVGLKFLGRSANLISLGAVDFGILVENAAVVLEVTLHGIALLQLSAVVGAQERARTIVEAVRDVSRPIGFATLIIVVGFIPLFLLERVEGRIFAPMAFTLVFALIGALVAAVTVVPALMFVLLRKHVPHGEASWFRWLQDRYRGLLWHLRLARKKVIGLSILAALALGLYAHDIGSEFLPELNEGGLYITAVFPSTVGLDETRRHVPDMRRRILALPEPQDVLSHIGRPEDATQIEGPNNVEFFVSLAPMERWRSGMTRHDLEAELRRSLGEIPGVQYNFSQPITDRVFETVSGIIGQIVVKVRGDDLSTLTQLAEDIELRLAKVHGVADLSIYQAGDVPQVRIDLDRDHLAQHGLTVAEVQKVVEVALGGKVATELWEGERRYGVALRLPDRVRQDVEALGRLVVGSAARRVTLAEVASIKVAQGRSVIWREGLSRFVAVKFNVRGSDMGSVVQMAQEALADMELPEGVRITWGGEFENQQRAMRRLSIMVPLTLFAMLAILFTNFRRWRPTILILGLLPVALICAIVFLKATGQNFSVSAAVGCVVLLGQVTLGGVLVCARIDERARAGALDPVGEGALMALRPVLLTISLAILGLVPAALSTGMGAESQRPFAITIIGGLVATLPLVLVLLPLLYPLPKGDDAPAGAKTPAAVALVSLVVLGLVTVWRPGMASADASPVAPDPAGVVVRDAGWLFRRWLETSPEIAAWRSEVGAARFDVVTAGLLPNPEIELTGSRLLSGAPPDGQINMGGTISIPIPVFGQPAARRAAAEAQLSAVEAEVRWRIWERMSELRDALLDLVFLRQEQQLVDVRLEELDALARIVASRGAAGVELHYDGMRIATAVAGVRADRDRRAAAIGQAHGRLMGLIADPHIIAVDVGLDDLRIFFVEGTPAALVKTAFDRRPDLLLARHNIRAAEALARQFRREVLPIPSITGGAYFTRDVNSASAIFGLSLPLPIFDRNQGMVGRAETTATGHRHQLATLEARIRAEVTAAASVRAQVQDALARMRPASLDQANDVRTRAKRAYQAGVFGITELLEAHESVWSVRTETLALERAVYEAEMQLVRVVGGAP